MKPTIGISDENRQAVAAILNRLAADEQLLLMKTKNAHWNVIGIDFKAMHDFFGEQYRALDSVVDSVAERIRALDHYPPATLEDILQLTRLTEKRKTGDASSVIIQDLLDDHSSIIMFIRENHKAVEETYLDAGTADYMIDLMERHEKLAWMLRASLEK